MARLTLEDWKALPEDNTRHYELIAGVLIAAPLGGPLHSAARVNLTVSLNWQLPETLAAIPNVEVVLSSGAAPTIRAPDVLVTTESRIRENPPRLAATDVLLAVEIISPASRTTDRVTKLAEYAEAGIPHYWVIDLDEPATLTAHNLVNCRYEIATKATEKVALVEPATITVALPVPVPVTVDVRTLTNRRR